MTLSAMLTAAMRFLTFLRLLDAPNPDPVSGVFLSELLNKIRHASYTFVERGFN
jgi:hypothetical protein